MIKFHVPITNIKCDFHISDLYYSMVICCISYYWWQSFICMFSTLATLFLCIYCCKDTDWSINLTFLQISDASWIMNYCCHGHGYWSFVDLDQINSFNMIRLSLYIYNVGNAMVTITHYQCVFWYIPKSSVFSHRAFVYSYHKMYIYIYIYIYD